MDGPAKGGVQLRPEPVRCNPIVLHERKPVRREPKCSCRACRYVFSKPSRRYPGIRRRRVAARTGTLTSW